MYEPDDMIDALGLATEKAAVVDAAHLERQRRWSRKTFGPGLRTKGIIEHITKEFAEIEADPTDLKEWVDVTILALDGAWRAGHEPQAILDAIVAKQTKNENRDWPDWRTADADHAIEHVRTPDRTAEFEAQRDAIVEAALRLSVGQELSSSTMPPGMRGAAGQMMTGWVPSRAVDGLLEACEQAMVYGSPLRDRFDALMQERLDQRRRDRPPNNEDRTR